MNRIVILALALAPALVACASPHVPAPDTRLPAAFEAPTTAEGPGVDLDRWWGAYNDAQLESLVDQALTSAPDAKSATARLEEALAIRSSALAAYNPQGDIEANSTRTDTRILSGANAITSSAGGFSFFPSGPSTTSTASFDVSWELDLFGRRQAARRKANADLTAARFDYAASRASLAANVADSLFQARGLAIQLEDARATAAIDRKLSDISAAKAAHGLGAQSDADLAASQAAQADANVADLESQLHAARRTLLVLVGRGADPLEGLPTPAEAGLPPKVPATAPGALLVRRPDVREASEQLRSALGQLKLDELALFPKFTLQPGVGLTSTNEYGPSITSDAWSIGLGLALPVLDRPRLESEIRAQGARADQAVIAYEKTVQTAYGEAENALTELATDERRITLLTAGEARGRAAYQAAQKRYELGLGDLVAALTAEQSWRNARSALTSAQVQALRRSVQAFKALGGGWPAPEPPTAS